MSDEQKMPEVARYDPVVINLDRVTMQEDKYGEYVTYTDHLAAIATLTAERDARDKKVRELVEAVLQTNKADILDWQYVYTLAAQLKEQHDG